LRDGEQVVFDIELVNPCSGVDGARNEVLAVRPTLCETACRWMYNTWELMFTKEKGDRMSRSPSLFETAGSD
jgi:hypothetical protein